VDVRSLPDRCGSSRAAARLVSECSCQAMNATPTVHGFHGPLLPTGLWAVATPAHRAVAGRRSCCDTNHREETSGEAVPSMCSDECDFRPRAPLRREVEQVPDRLEGADVAGILSGVVFVEKLRTSEVADRFAGAVEQCRAVRCVGVAVASSQPDRGQPSPRPSFRASTRCSARCPSQVV